MSGIIRYITAPPHLPQTHQVIFLPIVNYSNPIQTEPMSKFNPFNIFNKQSYQSNPQQYKTIQPPGNSPSRKYNKAQDEYQPNRRFDYNFGQNSFNNRDGWSSGVSGKQSPAISALALLGFLFFLNLIQNSLLNNRVLLTTTSAYNGTIIGNNVAFGRNGRVKRKRDVFYNQYNSTPESIPTHPNRRLQIFSREQDNPGGHADQSWLRGRRNMKFHSKHRKKQQISFSNTRTIVKSWIVQQIQQAAVGCLQLVACNMGRNIFKDADSSRGGGRVMKFLGQQLFPGSPRTRRSWTGRMVRAMSYGWGKMYTCDKLLKRCMFPGPFGLLFRT